MQQKAVLGAIGQDDESSFKFDPVAFFLLHFSPRTIRYLFNERSLEMIDQETALPYEKYLGRINLYLFLNKIGVSNNVICYATKGKGCDLSWWEVPE